MYIITKFIFNKIKCTIYSPKKVSLLIMKKETFSFVTHIKNINYGYQTKNINCSYK